MSDDNLLDIHLLCKYGIKRHVIIPLIIDLDNISSHQNIILICASIYFYVLPHISLGWLVGWVEFLFGQKPLFILLSCWHVIILISRPSLTSWEIARVFTQTVLWCMFWKTQHSNLKTSKNTTKNRSESCFRISTWSRQTTCKSSPMESLLPAQNTGHLCKVPNFQNPDLFSIHNPRLANKQLNQRNYYVLFNASWRILFLPTFDFYNVIYV